MVEVNIGNVIKINYENDGYGVLRIDTMPTIKVGLIEKNKVTKELEIDVEDITQIR